MFHRYGGRAVVLLVVVAIMLPLTAIATAASEMQPDTQAVAGDDADSGSGRDGSIRLADERVALDGSPDAGWTKDMWLWRKGGRGYTLARRRTPNSSTTDLSDLNKTVVIAYDLDSGVEVGRTTFDRAFAGFQAHNSKQTVGFARHMAVDEEGGRLFIPYTHGVSSEPPAYTAAKKGERCESAKPTQTQVGNACVMGVIVLDAVSLDEVARIPLGELTVDGGLLLGPQLLAMSYSPPPEPGASGKVLLLVQDNDSRAFGDFNGALHYVVQIDPTDRRVDWVIRAEGCRSNRQHKTYFDSSGDDIPAFQAINRRLNEGVVFRAGQPGARMVWVGCYQSNRTAAIVRIPLDAAGFPATVPYAPGNPADVAHKAADDPRALESDDVARPVSAVGQDLFIGPKEVREYLADPVSERILVRVVDGNPAAEVWWVFDGLKGAFIGTIGIGNYQRQNTVDRVGQATISGLDPSSGRFYVLAPRIDEVRPGGLFVTDVRRTPVPQALVFPQFAGLLRPEFNVSPIQVDYGDGAPGTPRRLIIRKGDNLSASGTLEQMAASDAWAPYFYEVVEDAMPVTEDPVVDLFAGRTVDLDEIEGVTRASFDAAARGFAARSLFIGGLTAAGRAGPADVTAVESTLADKNNAGIAPSQCARTNRQVVVGFVGPRDAAVVDGNGSRGGAEAVVVDSALRGDSELPVSRCALTVHGTSFVPELGTLDWDKVWSQGLFSRPPVGEPSVPWQFGDGDVSCVSSDEDPQDSFGDPVTGSFASRVECGAEEASGFGYARGVGVDGVNVSEAVSKFRIYRDPGRGIVSRVESIARGIDIGGVVRIDAVRGVAESWANGRAQFVADSDRDKGYDPNCDFERTAGTCFSRSIFGVKTPVYSCGPCGDEKRLADALSKAFSGNARVRLRDPDPVLRVGAPNGYVAAIQKPAYERFGDVVLNDDLLQTVVPVLEIIRYAPTGIVSDGRRGMQVYQFAGVEVSSSYGIQCLLVYDAVANTCGAELEPPGGITVNLTGPDGKGLAGGAFEVRRDVDADGVAGLKDVLIPDGACVTTDDGVGSCRFEGLAPGSYLVSQVAAPPGFGKVAEPFVVELASGEARTVTFVNSSSVSTINVSAADEAGKPVSGAVFAVYPDADADGKVAADAEPSASCTTDASGSCSMGVPAGSYVLVQTAAPGGLEPIEPVAFTFASGGQTAAVGVVNYPAGSLPQPEAAAAPTYSDAPASVVTETVTGYTLAEEPAVVDAPVSVPEVVGGTIVRVIQAPGDALRLLSRDPKQAAAWTASLLLFALAFLAIRRRQQATALIGS